MLAYHQKSFLIVDDFSDFRSSIRSMLRELGVKDVDTADTGEVALRMCSQKRYDFILQDYHLGDGRKNGQQVLEDLMVEKLISHESVFLMVTAETSQAMVLSALEHEPDAYLTKPFNRSGLAQRLERLEQRKTLLKPILQALDRGKPMEVLNACIALCKQDPRYGPLCLRYRADALRDLNQNEALERLYNSIIADRPLPWAYVGLGKLMFKRGQVGQAKAVYEKALKVFPMMPALYDGMADVLVAEGDTKQAQHVLEEAVRLSPLAVRRQSLLGKLAMTNEDYDTASRAYRQAVGQGAQSRFKDPESNLGLAHALISKGSEKGLDTRTRLEINTTLSAVAKENLNDPGLQVRARLMKATSLLLNDAETAEKLTEQALQRLDGMEQFMSAEAALLVAKQLQMLGQTSAGESMLKNCAEIYGDDPTVMQGIAKLTDDPNILNQGNAAAELNREGVRVYKTGALPEARELFRRALKMQPKNISIALNMAQSLLHGTDTSVESELLQECRACLKLVGMMPDTDARFARYQKLRSKAFGDE
ncbi:MULTISPECIES: tetratricopeptide repeat-containing response regulator [Pseudomonas]|uniref:Tetratricopeptide repeat-containing protein n=1 Tax=Pseudomonas kilonensis TaxID=132476 RepID=A0ABY0YK19_9PSED|nr:MULTISPECIES: tetratricopeptide repeat-containing response regulator [Pseudomonas]EPJ78621.1 response regulator receiver domain-containing protein [Pseudomonas sp. CFII68]OOG87108.1 response regulator [Pseudomonas sp. A25(2017)]SED65491.1 Tetratricopeptide repeat-containing protein [Pseudomonas kilonensis]